LKSSILAVIPARGGSKGLSRKNALPLGGKPLIAWTIEAARQTALIDRIVVSSDDEEIAATAQQWGAEAPFLRPAELATDMASTEVVLKHALEWIEERENHRFDILVYLQATDPFRRRGIVSEVLESLIADPTLDTVFAARPEHKNYWTFDGERYRALGRHNHVPRQQKQPLFREDTGVALASRASVIRSGLRIGDRVKLIPHEYPGDFIDIHDELDLRLANLLIEQLRVVPNEY
jgi:CMP-N-acetylneuraminic acid synthetase